MRRFLSRTKSLIKKYLWAILSFFGFFLFIFTILLPKKRRDIANAILISLYDKAEAEANTYDLKVAVAQKENEQEKVVLDARIKQIEKISDTDVRLKSLIELKKEVMSK